jgi:hypothetical protein
VERLDGLSRRPDDQGSVVRTVLFLEVRTKLEHCRPDDPCITSGHALASLSGQVLYIIRTRATCLLLSEVENVQTSSFHHPDGNPTAAIYCPDRRILSLTPTKSLFLAALE